MGCLRSNEGTKKSIVVYNPTMTLDNSTNILWFNIIAQYSVEKVGIREMISVHLNTESI